MVAERVTLLYIFLITCKVLEGPVKRTKMSDNRKLSENVFLPYTVTEFNKCEIMAMQINPPDFRKKSYERYRQELNAWKEVTEVEKKKQGIAVALTLPEEHESGIREKVFDEMDLNVLKAEDGLQK
jgi:hypothetical protein